MARRELWSCGAAWRDSLIFIWAIAWAEMWVIESPSTAVAEVGEDALYRDDRMRDGYFKVQEMEKLLKKIPSQ